MRLSRQGLHRLLTGCCYLLVLQALVAAATPAVASAAPAPTYWESKTPAQRAATKELAAKLTRNYDGGSYHPGGSGGYARKAGSEMADYVDRVTYTQPGAGALHKGTTQMAQEAKLWPRIGQSALNVARTRGAGILLKSTYLGFGGSVLWEIGCIAGAPFCRKQAVVITNEPVVATTIRYRWSGTTGSCFSGGATGGGTTAPSGGCVNGTGNNLGLTWTVVPLFVPPEVLELQFSLDGGSTWRTKAVCLGQEQDYPTSGTVQTNSPLTPCSTVEVDSPEGTEVVEGPAANGGHLTKITEVLDANGQSYATKRWIYTYGHTMKTWYQDPGVSRVVEPPRTTDPSAWSGVPDTDESRLKSTAPPPPSDTDLDGGLERFLEADTPEAELWRETLDYGLGQLPAEDDPVWEAGTPPAVPDDGPAYGSFAMPTCTTYASCVAALDAAGHNGTRTHVVLTDANADLSKPAGAVVSTDPAGGAVVTRSADVVITTNPDVLPNVVPMLQPGERYLDYIQRLNEAGLIGQATELSVEASDPALGPEEVVRTDPPGGSRLPPNTVVKVDYNNSQMPPVGEAGTCTTPTIPAIDFGPLSVPLGDNFPFGAPAWMADFLGSLGVAGQAPRLELNMPGGVDDLVIDLDRYTGLVQSLHPFLLGLSFISMLWGFAAGLAKFGPTTSSTERL